MQASLARDAAEPVSIPEGFDEFAVREAMKDRLIHNPDPDSAMTEDEALKFVESGKVLW